MKQALFTVIFLISLTLLVASNITVSGPLLSDTLWDADTVFVDGNVIIPNDTTLTINPGVKVEFQGYYSIDIYGTLLAEGSEAEMIHFTINDTTGFSDLLLEAGGWHGLRFENPANSNDSSKVVYCHLEYGKAADDPARSDKNGAGIYVVGYNNVLIANNIIENCIAQWGAGIYCSNSNPIIKNNIIRNNYARYAAAISCRNNSSPLIIGNVIYGNSVKNHGGGIHMRNNCSPLIINNTICDNTSDNIGAGLFMRENCSPSVFNNILWNNVSDGVEEQGFIWEDNCNPSFYNCAIEDSILGITLNPDSSFVSTYINHSTVIGFEPEFDNTVRYDNYELSATSPCVNTGLNMILLTLGVEEDLDIADNSRIYDGYFKRVDMGAVEYQGNPIEQYVFDGMLADYGLENYSLCADSVFIYSDIVVPDTVSLTICAGTYMEFQPFQYITRDDERWDTPYREGG